MIFDTDQIYIMSITNLSIEVVPVASPLQVSVPSLELLRLKRPNGAYP